MAAVLLIAGCGGSSSATSATGRAHSSTTAAVTATPAADPREAPIVQGYVNATKAFVHAAITQNPNDPAIPATTYGAELFTVSKNLGIDYSLNIVGRGDIQVRDPHVVSITGTSALLKDCRYSTLHMYNAKTGEPVQGVVGGQGGEDEGISATLIYVEGVWKVSAEDVKAGSCPPGY